MENDRNESLLFQENVNAIGHRETREMKNTCGNMMERKINAVNTVAPFNKSIHIPRADRNGYVTLTKT